MVSQILTNRSLNLCNNSDQTLFSNTCCLQLHAVFQHMLSSNNAITAIKHYFPIHAVFQYMLSSNTCCLPNNAITAIKHYFPIHAVFQYMLSSNNAVNAVFMFLLCQTESKTIVKENMLHNFCSQELQDGTKTDWARSAWKLLHIKVYLSPFLLMDLYTTTVVQLYSNHFVLSFSKHQGRIE